MVKNSKQFVRFVNLEIFGILIPKIWNYNVFYYVMSGNAEEPTDARVKPLRALLHKIPEPRV
jgi:hypothetical protein